MSFTDFANYPVLPPEPPASRNLRDAAFDGGGIYGAPLFALYGQPLPNGNPPPFPGTVTSTLIDLGPNFNLGDLELVLSVCKLPGAAVGDGASVTYEIWVYRIDTVLNGYVPDMRLLLQTVTGSGGAGIPAFTQAVRIPSGAQFCGARVTFGSGCGDASLWNGIFYGRF